MQAIRWAVEVENADIISMSLGWENEPEINDDIRSSITTMLTLRKQKLLLFAAASNFGSKEYDLYPASDNHVFSIRGTDANGRHETFNAALPLNDVSVIGTLGKGVPSEQKENKGKIGRTGTSPATAIAAGLATHILGHIEIHGQGRSWDRIRKYTEFEKLLYKDKISKESAVRKRFFTLEYFYDRRRQQEYEALLNSV